MSRDSEMSIDVYCPNPEEKSTCRFMLTDAKLRLCIYKGIRGTFQK